MRHHILFLFFLASLSVQAQPGSRGGIILHKITDTKGQKADSVSLSFFELKEDEAYTSITANSEATIMKQNGAWGFWEGREYKSFLYTANDSVVEIFLPYNEDHTDSASIHKRIILAQGEEIMVVDVVNMLSPNGRGLEAEIEQLVFEPGYFIVEYGCLYNIPEKLQLSKMPSPCARSKKFSFTLLEKK